MKLVFFLSLNFSGFRLKRAVLLEFIWQFCLVGRIPIEKEGYWIESHRADGLALGVDGKVRRLRDPPREHWKPFLLSGNTY